MIDKQLLKTFVVGLGTDEEVDLCESYLNDCDTDGSETVLDLQLEQETRDDSLIQSLRNSGEALDPFDEVTGEIHTYIQARLEATDIVKFLRPPESTDEIGRIGPYRLLKKIGSGGMGIVFRAENTESGSIVALKVMNPMMASNPLAAERFQREVRSAAKLDHARIIKIHDVGRDAGIPFFAMELLNGLPLGVHIEQNGRLPASEVKRLVTQIAEGLDYANQQGILHRDIKPDNLWLTDEGNVIILDFGLARGEDDTAGLTNTGDVLGTPRYMAPEQVKGQPTDHRTDLFSLGAVMYEMLSGSSKFADENVYASMMAVTQRVVAPEELTSIGCPTPLANLACTLLTKDPDGRPESAALVVQELEQMYLSPAIRTESFGGRLSSNWTKAAAIFAAIFLTAALGIFIYVKTDRGTLVIEAEPGVEITTNDTGAKIRLKNTNKTYDVSVGTKLLPSGTYEIIVDDQSDEFSFSTRQFEIRRGQQNLVTISLKEIAADSKVDAELAKAFTQKYAPVEKWFELNPNLYDESIFALATVAETDGRDFVFKLDASLNKTKNEFRIKRARFHYSTASLFGSRLQVMRDGKIIGEAKLLDGLPLKEGDRDENTSFIGRIENPKTAKAPVQDGDVVVVVRRRPATAKGQMASIGMMRSGPNPWDRGDKIRAFLAQKFPDTEKFYVASVSDVSDDLVRFRLDRYFDLSIRRPVSGQEYISNGGTRIPPLDGKKGHIYSGIQRIGYGKVTSLLGKGRDNFLQVSELLTDEPGLTKGLSIVIPATDHKDPKRFHSEANLTALPALPILETLGLKEGQPLSAMAMVSDPNTKPAEDGFSLDSWNIETKHHRAAINDMGINFEQDLVAVAGDDALVRIWNVPSDFPKTKVDKDKAAPTLRHVLPSRLPVKKVCWSPAGNIVAAATRDPIHDTGKVFIWRIADDKAELIQRIDISATELAFCPLGSRIAIHQLDSVVVFDLSTPAVKEIFSFDAIELTRCAWSPDGKTLVCTTGKEKQSKSGVSLIDVEKATIPGNTKFVFRAFPNCRNAGFTKLSNGASILSVVHDYKSKQQVSVFDERMVVSFANELMSSNSKITYRENHRCFFRVDFEAGINFSKTKNIYQVKIPGSAKMLGGLQFKKMEEQASSNGLAPPLQGHFVVDRKSNFIDVQRFIGQSTSDWFENMNPAEHDAANGFTFQLQDLDDAARTDSAQIKIRNILTGEVFTGPTINGRRELVRLIQKGAVSASPDGKQLAFLGSNVVRIYDLQSKSIREVEVDKFNGSPPHLVWSVDSKYLVVQHKSETGLTIIAPDSGNALTKINAESDERGMGFSDTSDRVLLDRKQSNQVFWRHRSDGVGFFDIETGQKLVERIVPPRAGNPSNEKGPWIASYDWHQATGRVCILIRDSMLENGSRLEIHHFDGDTIELFDTIELDSEIIKDSKPEFATFDKTAENVVLISTLTNDENDNQESSHRTFKIDLKTNSVNSIGTLLNNDQEFLTNRKVVVALSAEKVTVVSIADSKIHSVPFATDSLQLSRSLSRYGDQWLLICGRQTKLFDENFRLVSTLLTTPGQPDGVTLTHDGVANRFAPNKDHPIELVVVGVRESELFIKPYEESK